MSETTAPANNAAALDEILRCELANGDSQIASIAPILRHLMATSENSVFTDEIIARVRAMMADMARQVLDALAEAAGHDDERNHTQAEINALVDDLIVRPGLLNHVHALALEWQLAEKLQARLSLDPVLSPLLQALVASADPNVASTAMSLLTLQARFAQTQRRMQLPLGELPGDHFHAVLLALRSQVADDAEAQAAAVRAEQAIRTGYDESRNRLGLIARLVAAMGGGASAALDIAHAGAGMFLTALAMASGQDRDLTVLTTNETQVARFALALRAAGLKPQAIEEQFLSLHPEIALPEGFEQLGADRAAALLAHSAVYPG